MTIPIMLRHYHFISWCGTRCGNPNELKFDAHPLEWDQMAAVVRHCESTLELKQIDSLRTHECNLA